VIGCEAQAVMRDVIFDSCVIKRSHRGLAIHLSEESDVENVLFSNMVVETRLFHHKWWGRAEPIYVTAIPWTAQHKVGRVRHVRFCNVVARGENGVYIQGAAADRIEDLLLENVRVEITKTSKWAGGTCDIRNRPANYILTSSFGLGELASSSASSLFHTSGSRCSNSLSFVPGRCARMLLR
jgi:hypothetical protein